jgi:hypothetical protein
MATFKKETSVTVNFPLTSGEIADLVLIWVGRDPKMDLEKLTHKYVQNICRTLLEQHGKEILAQKIEDKLYLRRQEVISALRGIVEMA